MVRGSRLIHEIPLLVSDVRISRVLNRNAH